MKDLRLLLFFLIALGCDSQKNDNAIVSKMKGYRDLTFGMSKQEVGKIIDLSNAALSGFTRKKTLTLTINNSDYNSINGYSFDNLKLEFFDDSLHSVTVQTLYKYVDYAKILETANLLSLFGNGRKTPAFRRKL